MSTDTTIHVPTRSITTLPVDEAISPSSSRSSSAQHVKESPEAGRSNENPIDRTSPGAERAGVPPRPPNTPAVLTTVTRSGTITPMKMNGAEYGPMAFAREAHGVMINTIRFANKLNTAQILFRLRI